GADVAGRERGGGVPLALPGYVGRRHPATPDRRRPRERHPAPALRASYVSPPSADNTWPVMYDAASEPRNETNEAISSGRPARPRGIEPRISSRISGVSSAVSGVSTRPADTQFTVTPDAPTSRASARQRPMRPLFAAA